MERVQTSLVLDNIISLQIQITAPKIVVCSINNWHRYLRFVIKCHLYPTIYTGDSVKYDLTIRSLVIASIVS